MFYIDYQWDVYSTRLVLDREFDIKNAGWNHGDCFKLVRVDGRDQFIKLDPVEQFNMGIKVNGT